MNDPELKAMSAVYDALVGLDADTRNRVTDWVLAKLKSTGASSTKGSKRGRKPGSKNAASTGGAKVKKAKRGRKPRAASAASTVARKTRKRGRPPGSTKKAVKAKAAKKSGRGRGRPPKLAVSPAA
jgi:hypothetical protein